MASVPTSAVGANEVSPSNDGILSNGHAEPIMGENAIEKGVPVQHNVDGVYGGKGDVANATGAVDNGNAAEHLERPKLGDEQPSRSYIKRVNGEPTYNVRDYASSGIVGAPTSSVGRQGQETQGQDLPHHPLVFSSGETAPGYEGALAGQQTSDNGYPEEKKMRGVMNEGQAYRADGGVPGQPEQPAQPPFDQQQQAQNNQHLGAAVGVGALGGAGVALAAGQRRQNNDPSFAAERAMSPGPADGAVQRMSSLQINDQANAGPSPGPTVQPMNPMAQNARGSPTSPTAAGGADLGRGNTYRSNLSRNSTLRKGGAFANGSALQGQGVNEMYGREDLHERTNNADRSLAMAGAAGLASVGKINAMEAKDAKRLSKMIKQEAKTEALAVKGAIRELEALQKVQKEAAAAELKAQQKAAKAAKIEHKARMKFLKEKERFEMIEAELRARESDYEAKREHALNQTNLLADKTQELNDLRAQKAADDRERELKLLALKNPGHT